MIYLFHQVKCLSLAASTLGSGEKTHLHSVLVLELVGVDHERFLTVLLLDLIVGRVYGKIEDVVRADR